MSLLSNGDSTTNQDALLLISANTIPGDVVEVYYQQMYLGAAVARSGTPNWEFSVRMQSFGEYVYDTRIRRGDAYSEKSSITINYVEPEPFLSDAFEGTVGTFIHDHAPIVGSTWIRKYDVENNYAYDDTNFALSGDNGYTNSGLQMADFAGSLLDRWVWNEVLPPTPNYRVILAFVLNNQSGYVELAVFARGDGADAIQGYVQWQPDWSVQSQISLLSEGNAGFGTPTSAYNGSGMHYLELRVEGNVARLFLDNNEIQTRTFDTILTDPGQVGFAFRTVGDLNELTAVSINAFPL